MNTYKITTITKASEDDLIGLKESLAMLMEEYSDIVHVEIEIEIDKEGGKA